MWGGTGSAPTIGWRHRGSRVPGRRRGPESARFPVDFSLNPVRIRSILGNSRTIPRDNGEVGLSDFFRACMPISVMKNACSGLSERLDESARSRYWGCFDQQIHPLWNRAVLEPPHRFLSLHERNFVNPSGLKKGVVILTMEGSVSSAGGHRVYMVEKSGFSKNSGSVCRIDRPYRSLRNDFCSLPCALRGAESLFSCSPNLTLWEENV